MPAEDKGRRERVTLWWLYWSGQADPAETTAAQRKAARIATIAGLRALWTPPANSHPGSPGFVVAFRAGQEVARCRYKLTHNVDGAFREQRAVLATRLSVAAELRRRGIASALLVFLLAQHPGLLLAGESMNADAAAVHERVGAVMPGRVIKQVIKQSAHDPDLPATSLLFTEPRLRQGVALAWMAARRFCRYHWGNWRLRRRSAPTH